MHGVTMKIKKKILVLYLSVRSYVRHIFLYVSNKDTGFLFCMPKCMHVHMFAFLSMLQELHFVSGRKC